MYGRHADDDQSTVKKQPRQRQSLLSSKRNESIRRHPGNNSKANATWTGRSRRTTGSKKAKIPVSTGFKAKPRGASKQDDKA
jgi:hypothetical protein